MFVKKLATDEDRINYEDLSYRILFYEETSVKSHEINFLKKYGTLYSLLEDLVSSKITVDIANTDQISFIIHLTHGYENDHFLIKKQK